jgi:hypothetical protein
MWKHGQIYRCTNKSCGCEIMLSKIPSGVEPNKKPRCFCGAEMKKPYLKPSVRDLSVAEAEPGKVLAAKHKA